MSKENVSSDRDWRECDRQTMRTEPSQRKTLECRETTNKKLERALILHETPSGGKFADGVESARNVPDVDIKALLFLAAQV